MQNLLITALVFLAVAIHGVQGGAMVTGTVFCDQCKDGQVSLFDYPLSGMKVTITCPGIGGQMSVVGEETTNMLGNYAMSFDGTTDLSSCYTQIVANSDGPDFKGCEANTGPPKSVRLIFSMFDMTMYSVDPLISQPAKPMSFCPISFGPPTVGLAPTPLPPMPPLPFFDVTACSHEYWLMPEYICYWRAVSPELTVAVVFGPVAAKKYGTAVTLWGGLQGRGDPYRTLLREAITALLNSYNSFRFPYNALQVLHHFNSALTTASTRTILLTALRFKRANYGHDNSSCKFTPCK